MKLCPECTAPLRQLEAPRDNEWECTAGGLKGHGGILPPIYATCPVCQELHETGKMDQWWECYLTDDGLSWLLMYYGVQSDPKSYAICRLVDELRTYRALLREPA